MISCFIIMFCGCGNVNGVGIICVVGCSVGYWIFGDFIY